MFILVPLVLTALALTALFLRVPGRRAVRVRQAARK